MLCFIAGYIEHHGYAPSLREMAAAVGLASKSGARVLARLEVRGMIRRRHNLARGSRSCMRLPCPAHPMVRRCSSCR
jgi:SOS-response transcriptional repressor LexA